MPRTDARYRNLMFNLSFHLNPGMSVDYAVLSLRPGLFKWAANMLPDNPWINSCSADKWLSSRSINPLTPKI